MKLAVRFDLDLKKRTVVSFDLYFPLSACYFRGLFMVIGQYDCRWRIFLWLTFPKLLKFL